MLTLVLEQVKIGSVETADGGRTIAFQDPQSGIQVQVPLTADDVRTVTSLLEGTQVKVAQGIPDALLRTGSR